MSECLHGVNQVEQAVARESYSQDAMRDPYIFEAHLAKWEPLVLCSELRLLENAQRAAFDTILMNVLGGPLRKGSLPCV